MVLWLNSKGFDADDLDRSGDDSPELITLKLHVLAIETQLCSASRDILNLRQQKKFHDDFTFPTPPSTPSPPKFSFSRQNLAMGKTLPAFKPKSEEGQMDGTKYGNKQGNNYNNN